MKWRDVAELARARNAALVAEGKAPTPIEEGVAYYTDDGTPHGRWRVIADDETRTSWTIWDMRRVPDGGKPVRAMGGFVDHRQAIIFADFYARSKALRLAGVVITGLASAVACLRRIPDEWRREAAQQ